MAESVISRLAVGTAGRTLVILNPAAGRRDPAQVRRRIGGAFAVRGAAFDLVETSAAGDVEHFAREAARLGYSAVAIAGGDGSVAEAITGLAGTDVPIGIIAHGTANLVAANLGIPLETDAAVDTIVHGIPLPIDVGVTDTGRHFALIAGSGWDAELMRTATRRLKERFGFGAYLFAALRRAATPPSALFRITADGQSFEIRAATVLIANIGHIFHAMLPVELSIAPKSSVNDGFFDICIFAPRTLPDVAAVLWKVANRQYTGDPRMIFLRAREIRIDADPPVISQIDGDVVGTTPLSASVIASGARLIVPRTAGEALA